MKKNYTVLLLLMIFATSLYAQNIKVNGITGYKYDQPVIKNKSESKAPYSFYIDYDAAEQIVYDQSYVRYYWTFNRDYSMALGDTNDHKNLIVGFDSIYDYNNFFGFPAANIQSYTVDTIYAYILHKNTTGTANHFIVSVIGLDIDGYPVEANVLWKDTVSTNVTLDPDYIAGDLFNTTGYVIALAPDFTLPAGVTSYGVKLDYVGARADTAAFLCGFGDIGPLGSCTEAAAPSEFDPNTYALWVEYESYGILPTASGANIYYDCNGSGAYDAGDGASYLQNGNIWVHVTIESDVSVEDLRGNVHQVNTYPNPTASTTNIEFTLDAGADVKVDVYSVSGAKVMSVDQGKLMGGNHIISLDVSGLENGMYYYTLTADNYQVSKKINVLK